MSSRDHEEAQLAISLELQALDGAVDDAGVGILEHDDSGGDVRSTVLLMMGDQRKAGQASFRTQKPVLLHWGLMDQAYRGARGGSLQIFARGVLGRAIEEPGDAGPIGKDVRQQAEARELVPGV